MFSPYAQDLTCVESPNSSWQMGQGRVESCLVFDVFLMLDQTSSFSSWGGAPTNPSRWANVGGGGASSKVYSTSAWKHHPAQ